MTPSKGHDGKAVLILTDVVGYKFKNTQLIADQFAANGYPTYVPDLFNGDPVQINRSPGFDLQKWLKGAAGGGQGPGHGPEQTDPIVDAVIKHLREKAGVTKLAAAGYYFGAKYLVRHMDKALAGNGIDVGYVAHPSFVEEDELLKLNGPLSIAAAGKQFPS